MNFEKKLEDLKQMRDELQLQIHLMGKEMKQKFEESEEKWKNFRARVKDIQSEAETSSENVKAAAKLLADELEEAYQHIRDRVKAA